MERDVVSGGRVAGTRHVFPEAEETGARRVPRAEEARVGVGKKEVPQKAKYVGLRAKVTTEEGWRLRFVRN